MRIWDKKAKEEPSAASVARAALAGASLEQLLQEALRALTQVPQPDRVGIWLEPNARAAPVNEFAGAFHGLVWDRTAKGKKDEYPPEWRILSLEPPLPERLLIRAEPLEQDLGDSVRNAVIGQLVGLRRALWMPIGDQEHVRGLILLGSVNGPLSPFLERAKSVAAELALAMDAREQLHAVRIRNADLAMVRAAVEARSTPSSLAKLLTDLVADCVSRSPHAASIGATFALIGTLWPQDGDTSAPHALDFRWRAGDGAWTGAISTDFLAKLWRRALEARQVIGSDPPLTWPQASVARILAFPLESEGQVLGVLVAGLPTNATSIAALERLELRARLAAFALLRSKRREEDSRNAGSEQALLDLVHDPLFVLDPAGGITGTSLGAREILRRAGQPSVLPSGYLPDLFCGRDRERIKRWLQQVIAPSVSDQALRKETPQAELQNGLKVRLQLAPRALGQVPAVLLRLESRPQADYTEAELQNVIEWLEEGVILFDDRENIRAMNTRFEQIAGLTPGESGKFKTLDELIARLSDQAFEPAQFAERWRELARNIQGGVREPLQMARPVPRVLERAARPVLDSIGRQVGRVEIYRDLTAQRVFQSKLLQTEKLAALGQMVSGVAHELSSPLTSILGYAQRLLVAQTGPGQDALERAEEARQIYQEAERATNILRQLLSNARETIPERRLISLNQIVIRATELQRFSLAADKIRVELDLDPTLPFIHGDAGQLQQVLINLLTNARHAAEEQGHGGVICLRTRRSSGRRVLLEVEDNGPGIPQAIQARIFDPFFTTKPAGVGTGLGLSIVLSVVREHGGSVRLQSPPKGGALFQIEIPAASERQQEEGLSRVAQVPEDRKLQRRASLVEEMQLEGQGNLQGGRLARESHLPAEQLAAPAHALADPVGPGKGARVLVVEDEPTVAQLIADVLKDEGMRVDVVLDGREALERAARESYDLVICDMKMPGLDGQYFYRSLARNGNSLRDRFLFVTGDIIAAQTREFLKRHGLPHVAKPFRVEELTEKVHTVLQTYKKDLGADVARQNAARNG
jgi:signal transduction histidine kinase/ActR/RegA family two-component response regulator